MGGFNSLESVAVGGDVKFVGFGVNDEAGSYVKSEHGKGIGWGLDTGREAEQTMSRIRPLVWVGKSMCWVRWKQSRRERSDVSGALGWSM